MATVWVIKCWSVGNNPKISTIFTLFKLQLLSKVIKRNKVFGKHGLSVFWDYGNKYLFFLIKHYYLPISRMYVHQNNAQYMGPCVRDFRWSVVSMKMQYCYHHHMFQFSWCFINQKYTNNKPVQEKSNGMKNPWIQDWIVSCTLNTFFTSV